jgi:acyl carrier protein
MVTLEEIRQIVADVLQLGPRAQSWGAGTALLGSVPEFDSMAVVSVITAIEEHYGVSVDDDEVGAETFETLGRLHAFVAHKVGG